MTEENRCPENGQPTFASLFEYFCADYLRLKETVEQEIFTRLLRAGVDIDEADRAEVLGLVDYFGAYPAAVEAIISGLTFLQEAATDRTDFARLLRTRGKQFVSHCLFADTFGFGEMDGIAVLQALLKAEGCPTLSTLD